MKHHHDPLLEALEGGCTLTAARNAAKDYTAPGWSTVAFILDSAKKAEGVKNHYTYWLLRVISNREDYNEKVARYFNKEDQEFIDQVSRDLETTIVCGGTLDQIADLLEDGPIDLQNTMRLLLVLGSQTEVTPGVTRAFETYQSRYDWNKVDWPEDIKVTCQNLAAEIAIKIQLHKEAQDKACASYHQHRPHRAYPRF